MSVAIVSSRILVPGGGFITNPIAGTAYWLALAWGPGVPGTASPTLSIPGATIDTTYGSGTVTDKGLSLGGLQEVDRGWHPDGLAVYLDIFEAATGLWKVTFPSSGSYTASLSGVSGTVSITAVGTPAAPTSPTVTLVNFHAFGPVVINIVDLSFSGTYPAGGLDLTGGVGGLIGLMTPTFAHINDTAAYRFAWVASTGKLHVYTSSGEASGSISFSTRAAFHGASL